MKKKLYSGLAIFIIILLLMQTCFAAAPRVTSDDIVEASSSKNVKVLEELVHRDETDIIDETVDAKIIIDEDSEPIYYDHIKYMLGIQYETVNGLPLMIDKNYNVTDEFKEINKELFKQPIVRWGGTSSNYFNLANWILPVAKRENMAPLKDIGLENIYANKVIPSSTRSFDTTYGFVPWVKLQLENNPDVIFDITLSFHRMHPEDTVTFLHFCLDPNGSSEWATLRASYGIENPLNIYSLEMGNELYFTKTPEPEYAERATQWYIDTFMKHAKAIEEFWPDIKLLGCINCNSSRGGFYEWNRPIIRELGKAGYKYFAFHLYYSGYELPYTQPWIDNTIKIAEEELGPDHGIKLCFTEHAKWGSGHSGDRLALASALATAQFFNRMYQRDDVDFATIHCGFTDNGLVSWGWVTKTTGKELVYTALNPMFKMYGDNIGDRVLRVKQEGESPIVQTDNYGYKFSVLATPKGSKQMVLFLCNREPYTDINVQFEWKNNYTLKKEIQFTTPNIHSFPASKDSMDIYRYTETEKNVPNFTSYHMPNKSLVCLILESDKPIGKIENGGDGEAVYSGDTKYFTDIDYNWANNEINILADEGIISGVGDSKYSPESYISKAEFAAMFLKAMKVGIIENASPMFSDVSPMSWFYNYANTLALKGIVRKTGIFEPDNPINISDAVCMLYTFANGEPAANSAGYGSTYNWYNSLSEHEKNAFGYALDNNLLTKLFEHRGFSRDNDITRAEAAALIYKFKTHYGI
ncbi:MAG: S-layer homology domain-containing protein [Clostridia bacterium]|nr:S-layer homology domain-containing protein [Clostridia bacterium]